VIFTLFSLQRRGEGEITQEQRRFASLRELRDRCAALASTEIA